VSSVFHDNRSITITIPRTAQIHPAFNRPVDNTTLIYGTNLLFSPALASATISYDNTTQILSIQPSYQDNNISSYTLTLKDTKTVDQQSSIPSFTHEYKIPQAGLRYVTWSCAVQSEQNWDCTTTPTSFLRSGVWLNNLYQDWSSNIFYDSGAADYFALKLEGYFKMPGNEGQNYTVYFQNYDDDGSILKIDNVSVIDDWNGVHGITEKLGSITLVGGNSYFFERYFNERDGAAVMSQKWKIVGIHSDYIFMNGQNDFFHYSN